MVEVVQMSLKEADRYAVIQQVIERTMGLADAALWLNISVRQVKRLARAIRQDGAQGAVSKRWGFPANERGSGASTAHARGATAQANWCKLTAARTPGLKTVRQSAA